MSGLIVKLSRLNGNTETYRFASSEIIIGRLEQNDISLPMTNVSKRHAVIRIDNGIVFITDVGSTNGTYVNKQRINQPTALGPNDEVYIGDFILTAQIEYSSGQSFYNSSQSQPGQQSYSSSYNAPGSSPGQYNNPGGNYGAQQQQQLGSNTQVVPTISNYQDRGGVDPNRRSAHGQSQEPNLQELFIEDPQDDSPDAIRFNRVGAGAEATSVAGMDDSPVSPSRSMRQTFVQPFNGGAVNPQQGGNNSPSGSYNGPRPTRSGTFNQRPAPQRQNSGATQAMPQAGRHPQDPNASGLTGDSSNLGAALANAAREVIPPPDTAPIDPEHSGRRAFGRNLPKDFGIRIDPKELFFFPDELESVTLEDQDDLAVAFAELVHALKNDGHEDLENNFPTEKGLKILESLSASDAIKEKITAELTKLGPIDALLSQPDVSQLFINAYDQIVVVEDDGQKQSSSLSNSVFSSELALKLVAKRLLIDDEPARVVQPKQHAIKRFDKGVASIYIQADGNPIIVIKKDSDSMSSLEDLIERQILSTQISEFLKTVITIGANIVIAGPPSVPKTLILSAFNKLIPNSVRNVYISRGANLSVSNTTVKLDATNAKHEDVVRKLDAAVALCPDRVIMDAVEGPEAYEWAVGVTQVADGTMTTLLGNSPIAALDYLFVQALTHAGLLTPFTVKEQIARAVDYIVVVNRVSGRIRVTHVAEMLGHEVGGFRINDIFHFKQTEPQTGIFFATGYIPKLYEELREQGVDLDISIFQAD